MSNAEILAAQQFQNHHERVSQGAYFLSWHLVCDQHEIPARWDPCQHLLAPFCPISAGKLNRWLKLRFNTCKLSNAHNSVGNFVNSMPDDILPQQKANQRFSGLLP